MSPTFLHNTNFKQRRLSRKGNILEGEGQQQKGEQIEKVGALREGIELRSRIRFCQVTEKGGIVRDYLVLHLTGET